MQQQPRRAQPAPVVHPQATHAEMTPARHAFTVLDLEQLALVSGGDGEEPAPKKFWSAPPP